MSTTDHASTEWTVETTPSGHTYHRIERGAVYASLVTYGNRPPVFATMKAHGATALLKWFDTVADAKAAVMGLAREIGALAVPPVAVEPRRCDGSCDAAISRLYQERDDLRTKLIEAERRRDDFRRRWENDGKKLEEMAAKLAAMTNRAHDAERDRDDFQRAFDASQRKLADAESRIADLARPAPASDEELMGEARKASRQPFVLHVLRRVADFAVARDRANRSEEAPELVEVTEAMIRDAIDRTKAGPLAPRLFDALRAHGPVGVPAPKVAPAAKVIEQPAAWGVCYDNDGSVAIAAFDTRGRAELYRSRYLSREATIEPLYRGAPPVATPGPVTLVVDAPVWVDGCATMGSVNLRVWRDGREWRGAISYPDHIWTCWSVDESTAQAAAFAQACAINGARPAAVAPNGCPGCAGHLAGLVDTICSSCRAAVMESLATIEERAAAPRFIVVPRSEVNGRPANVHQSEEAARHYVRHMIEHEEFYSDIGDRSYAASKYPWAVVDTKAGQ